MRLQGILIVLFLVSVPATAEPIEDAKRKAASDLMRDGKTLEAVALIQEVIAGDATNYRDHLFLARAHDKLNNANDAVRAYQSVLSLASAAATGSDERAARAEAERRLRVLDQATAKVRGAAEDFLKRLDVLDKEAMSARDARAAELVFRLKAGVYRAAGRKDAGGAEVQVAAQWQESGVFVTKGRQYRIRAVGTWMFGGKIPCSAEGISDQPLVEGIYPRGALLAGVVGGTFPPIHVRSSFVLVAPSTGVLSFTSSATDQTERQKGRGSLFVIIEPLN